MTLRLEVAIYQPANRSDPSIWLDRKEIDEVWISQYESLDLDILTGIFDDNRPVFLGVKILEGDFASAFPEATFAFRVQRKSFDSYGEGDQEESDDYSYDPIMVHTVTADWTTDWKGYFIAFDEGAEITKVQVYWGAPLPPE